MRGYEKEIIQAGIKNEEEVIKQLKQLYSESLEQINTRISELMAKNESQQLQSIIYQLDYQKALKTQISGILDQLQASEYEKISDFLNNTYQDGFIGSMYAMKKQGIPLIIPMDQEQILNAIVHKSKISKGLYEALGFNVNELKKRISSEVSRGIANGFSYQEIARNINNTSKIGINKAVRIARTEGHRIQAQAQLDASHKAKKKGADVVKQWDATLDGRTRPSHRKLDGQIRELDEPFEIGGHKAQAPSQFGRPSEDINCRCVILQRARWGLDEEELKTLEERAKFHGLDKTKDFEEYKEKYLKAVEKEVQLQETPKPKWKENLNIVYEELNVLNETLLNENIAQFNALTEKFPKMQRYMEEHNFRIGITKDNVIAYNQGYVLEEVSHQTINLSVKKYKNYDEFIEMEKRLRETKWGMPCAESQLSVYSMTHEYGHAVHNVIIKDYINSHYDEFLTMKNKVLKASSLSRGRQISDKWQSNIIKNCVMEIKKIAQEENPNLDFLSELSTYGKSNWHEAFAEIFANSQCGKPNILGRAMNKWLEGVMK